MESKNVLLAVLALFAISIGVLFWPAGSPQTGAGSTINATVNSYCISLPADTQPIKVKGNEIIYAQGYAQHYKDKSIYPLIIHLSNASVNLPCTTSRVNAAMKKGSIHSITCYPIISEVKEAKVVGQVLTDENGTLLENATNIYGDFITYCGGPSAARVNTANATSYIVLVESDLFGVKDLSLGFGGVSLG